jgi:DivIVA domain-containing protein
VNGYEVRSKQFRLGLRGYNKNDVDMLLDRVAIALDRKQTPAAIVKQANFRIGLRGYQVDEVDQFLKDCISTAQDGERAVADPSTIPSPPQRSKRAVMKEHREAIREQKNTGGRVERESRQERIDRVLHPGEGIIAQTTCQEGLWPGDSGTDCVVAITNERLLTFRATWFLSRNSGELLEEMDLDKVRTVDSKTTYVLLGIPVVRTQLECDDGQVVQIVSPGIAFRRARLVAKALTDRIGRTPPNAGEASPP